ncbi:dTDP-4-dehydrorhamnose reductase [Halomonas sp. 328]|uniref:dTDP-4-dehydrorhamnose reductase n=1 Tax=Halomonas sp. 328 TaxID=2776704 RepID=UPI0018A74118|nr:dTDP-4-dehydrorhamnose reductase [Halomonas sp. 328]MBF8223908.1 dTDP-4-dehydrorhamnose reductase [Halomonas sp. 328]
MKILITGGSGQVGFELQRSLLLFGDILAPGRTILDLYDAQAVTDYLEHNTPDLIVNAAAYTDVDKAEEQRDSAWRLNADMPAQLADHAARHDIPLVHYSSDYVYSGEGHRAWQEDDAPAPLNVYGRTKLAGDQAIQGSGCRHLIFRTSWVYGLHGRNFVKTMLRLGKERDVLKVVDDQVGAPTSARLIAQVTALALHRWLLAPHTSPVRSGLYHLAPQGETTWHGIACEIFRQAAAMDDVLRISPERVAAIPTAEYPTPARRPLNSRLCCQALEQALGITLPTWQRQLVLTMQEIAQP